VSVIRSVTVDGFTATDVRFSNGSQRAPHAHEVGQISLVLEGRWSEQVGETPRRYAAGDIVVRPSDSPDAACIGCESARLVVVEIGRKRQHELCSLFPAMDAPVRIHAEIFDGIAPRLTRALSSNEPTSRLELSSALLELVAGVSRLLLSRPAAEREIPEWLRAAVRFVEHRYDEPIALRHVAREVGVSSVRLAQAFRRLRGCSMGAWLRRRRVRVSAERLLFSKEPVRTIAATAGFHDASHLTREFKRATGMTPGEFRRSAR
jgi:AraC-like DNA-binding protein